MKLIHISICFFLWTSSSARATSQSQACNSLKQIQIEMAVIASNVANAKTTRTPDGGPYRPKRFKCESGICDVQAEAKVKKIYEPEHPDADSTGYVVYPDINIVEQTAEMNHLIHAYDEAATICFNKIDPVKQYSHSKQ